MNSPLILLLSLSIILTHSINYAKVINSKDTDYKVVCYWGSWSFYRPNAGQFDPKNIDPKLCTHLMYGFAKLNEETNKIEAFEPGLDLGSEDWESGLPWGRGMYRKFNALREQNPSLKTIISIGGWNEGSDKYSRMVFNPQSRAVFVQSVVDFLAEYKFDGLDVDWEYPGQKAVGDQDREPGNEADKENFVILLRELRAALKPKGYLLGAAVSAGAPTIDRGYNVKEVSELLDFINLMTYDFNGGWESKTSHNAPLYHWENPANDKEKQFTVSYGVDHWLKLGVDPKKLIMGLPLYGRGFTLANPLENGFKAPATGKGCKEGPYTRQTGILGYMEICDNFKTQPWNKLRDDIYQKVPYAVYGDQWIGYDDQQSLREKVAFLKNRGLGGACVWSIDMDDFSGSCGEGKFPLLTEINKALKGSVGPGPGPNPEPTSATPPPNPPPTSDFQCTQVGTFPDPKDPTIFHRCIDQGNGQFQHIQTQCPSETIYDPALQVCDHK
ncbi:chitinase-3-like protein 1 [Oppia nitens]|uniref:chitinase-3-like protein 1 n=1 Tax=Oppia nitens TaxID=1686743 RepID=UPI0023DA0645|nr:chitinase-3-like protein 1 [Oppia nitens]